MAPLGPFAAGRTVMAAVSGGADSMALALLLSRWGNVRAAIVDHGMRPESAGEVTLTAWRLSRLGIPSTILRAELSPGAAAAERARSARYRLLLTACRDAGCADLLLAHHAGDQAETVQMRQQAGSLPSGLAGMAAIIFHHEARLLRPLLPIPSSRLKATLRQAGVEWVEDPTNTDQRTLRARLRATMDPAAVADALALGQRMAALRSEAERQVAADLAAVRCDETGFALLPNVLGEAALSAVIWAISGQPYPPPRAALSAGLSTRSVHGVLLRPAGRLGPFVLAAREPDAVAPSGPAEPGRQWDGRFRLGAVPVGCTVGALGQAAARIGRRSGLPSIVRQTLPALRRDGEIVAVPHLGFPDAASCRSVAIWFAPSRPVAGAVFINPSEAEGM